MTLLPFLSENYEFEDRCGILYISYPNEVCKTKILCIHCRVGDITVSLLRTLSIYDFNLTPITVITLCTWSWRNQLPINLDCTVNFVQL